MKLDREMRMALIEDHASTPRGWGMLPQPLAQGQAHNPRCGDTWQVFVSTTAEGRLEVRFQGYGCMVSTASGSMMAELMQGLPVQEAQSLLSRFETMIAGESPEFSEAKYLDLNAFYGIHENPLRHRCAGLAWQALKMALQQVDDPATDTARPQT